MTKLTNRDIKDAAYLHIVHNLQHPSSRPTTESTKITIVNPSKKNFSSLPAGRYRKSPKRSTQQGPHVNEGKCSLEVERIRALGALRRLRSKMKLAAELPRETHFLNNEEKEKWIQEYVERETAGARKRIDDAEAAVQKEHDDMTHAEIAGLTSREPEKTFVAMLVAIGDSLSALACSDDGEDGKDEDDEETELGNLREDDEPGWVMGTITKTVQQRMERFRQKQMKPDKLTQPGLEDTADNLRERDKKYSTTESWVPAVVLPQTYDDSSATPPATFGEVIESLDIVPVISKRPREGSRPGCSHIRLGSVKPQSNSCITGGEPAAEPDSSTLLKATPVEPVSFYRCI
jgi:hypothetical protein